MAPTGGLQLLKVKTGNEVFWGEEWRLETFGGPSNFQCLRLELEAWIWGVFWTLLTAGVSFFFCLGVLYLGQRGNGIGVFFFLVFVIGFVYVHKARFSCRLIGIGKNEMVRFFFLKKGSRVVRCASFLSLPPSLPFLSHKTILLIQTPEDLGTPSLILPAKEI